MNNERITGFKNQNDFSIRIEQIKDEQQLDTYIDAVVWFSENECDEDIDALAKYLNKKIKDAIRCEAVQLNLLKDKTKLVSIF